MDLDINSKHALELGRILMANIELGHRLEAANTMAAQHAQRADKLQAELNAAAKAAADAAAAQAKHDAAADARDMPSDAPAP